jgi:hypothetical protein
MLPHKFEIRSTKSETMSKCSKKEIRNAWRIRNRRGNISSLEHRTGHHVGCLKAIAKGSRLFGAWMRLGGLLDEGICHPNPNRHQGQPDRQSHSA